MQAPCLVVPKQRGEEIRRTLLEMDALEKHLSIVSMGDRLYIPVSRSVDLGFPVERREFGRAYVPTRSYKDDVEVPPGLQRSLPRSFDVVGDIAVIKVPEELRDHREAIGGAILRWNPRIRVVLEDRGVKGEHRVRDIDVIAGERRTTTVHTEHGLRYRVDLATAYFSPRLATERKRIADLAAADETVADPFAGVGPYAVLIARRRRPQVVYASDANPAAVDLLRINVATNRADRVTIMEGDVRTVLSQLEPVDRVILDLPHLAREFLSDAFATLRAQGTVHLYRILERAEEADATKSVRAVARDGGFRITSLWRRHVRAYSPTRHQVAFDITVARA